MIENSINNLIEDLAMHSKARKRIRRRVCAYLRENERFVRDSWLQRKIDLKYLGDLSDSQLVESVNEILIRKGDVL